MPYRPRRWKPSDATGRRATVGGSMFGGLDAPLSTASSTVPGDDIVPDSNYEDVQGYNPQTPVYPQNQQPTKGLLPPVSQGGSGRGSFSIGNPAHGTINLGAILGPRSNSNFNPNNPGAGELPYQTPGFFRRLFGDTGSDLNAAYSQQQNAQTLTQRQRDTDWARRTAFEKEKQSAGFDQQWGIEKARLDMDAARSNLQASTALKEREIQQAGINEREAADRAAREEERYGPDPILASMLKRQEAESRVGLAGVKPLGSGAFAMRDPYTGEVRYFMQEGGTPGGVSMGQDGNLQMIPPRGRTTAEFDPNRPPGAQSPTGTQAPPSSDPNRLAADEIELLRKAAGASSPPSPTAPVEPWFKRPTLRPATPPEVPTPSWLRRLIDRQ